MGCTRCAICAIVAVGLVLVGNIPFECRVVSAINARDLKWKEKDQFAAAVSCFGVSASFILF